jgi:hypothetical protein
MLHAHRAAADAADDEALQEGGPVSGNAATALAIPVLA